MLLTIFSTKKPWMPRSFKNKMALKWYFKHDNDCDTFRSCDDFGNCDGLKNFDAVWKVWRFQKLHGFKNFDAFKNCYTFRNCDTFQKLRCEMPHVNVMYAILTCQSIAVIVKRVTLNDCDAFVNCDVSQLVNVTCDIFTCLKPGRPSYQMEANNCWTLGWATNCKEKKLEKN